MTFASASQFHIYLPWVNACLAQCLNSVLNVKALVGPFNLRRVIGKLRVIFVWSSNSDSPPPPWWQPPWGRTRRTWRPPSRSPSPWRWAWWGGRSCRGTRTPTSAMGQESVLLYCFCWDISHILIKSTLISRVLQSISSNMKVVISCSLFRYIWVLFVDGIVWIM